MKEAELEEIVFYDHPPPPRGPFRATQYASAADADVRGHGPAFITVTDSTGLYLADAYGTNKQLLLDLCNLRWPNAGA